MDGEATLIMDKKNNRGYLKGIAFGVILKRKSQQSMLKGIAFDEAVNAMVFFACIVFLGILFYVFQINVGSIFAYGGNFVSQIGSKLVASLLNFI
jgi:hypothetical protein